MEDRLRLLISKYLSKEASKREVEELRASIKADGDDKEFFAKVSKIWLEHKREGSSYDIKRGQRKLRQKIENYQTSVKSLEKKAVSRRVWSVNQPFLVAASIAVFLLIGVSVFNMYFNAEKNIELAWEEKFAPKGARVTYILQDGSKVKLNSNSKIRFRKDFLKGDTREVILEGEAFFEVTKNKKKPFIVTTNTVSTKVLGTSFNVRAFPQEPQAIVALVEGRVEVVDNKIDSNNRSPEILSPMDCYVFDKKSKEGQVFESVDLSKMIAWRDNILLFDNDSLGDVAKVVEDWYGVEIRFQNPALRACLIKASFENESLKNVLEVLKYATSLEYTKDSEGIITFSGKGCG
ncbi:FecR family protein [Flammeovirgaceae bacterium SG7u.111]|nr:FecR family protein [Flammeovirgaceae bacterium SG7u.132]WPO34451.1 FecR family protein [Flammeovirgaceae bacterium SG7u.111]